MAPRGPWRSRPSGSGCSVAPGLLGGGAAAALGLQARRCRPQWPWRLPRAGEPSGRERPPRKGRRPGEGLPGLNMLQDLWRRRLRVSAVLAFLLIAAWCWQGYGGWRSLLHYNENQWPYLRLPSSTAFESWLWGVHPFVDVHGRREQVTVSPFELDFRMDRLLVNECGQLHRLLTGCFLHGSVLHAVFNLGYLYTLAPLEAGSSGAYLCTFLLAGIAGNLAFLAAGPGRCALGASAALCGLIGFDLVSRLRMRQVREFRTLLQQTFGLLVLGAILPGVANVAHVAGLVTGVLVSFLTSRRSGYRRALVPWPALMVGVLATPQARHFVRALCSALALGAAAPGALGRGAVLTL